MNDVTIDEFVQGLEEVVREEERAKVGEKLQEFIVEFRKAFDKLYEEYKTHDNPSSRSPQTRIFRDWLRNRYRAVRNAMQEPYKSWCSGDCLFFDSDRKEIYWRLTVVIMNFEKNIEIRSRDWTYTEQD